MKIKRIRQLVLTAVCALAAIACHAEEYLPFLEIGKWWIVSEVEVGGEVFCYWKLSVTDSETIDDKEFFKVRIHRVSEGYDRFENFAWTEDQSPFATLSMTFCEDNDTVYRVFPDDAGGYKLTQLFSLDMQPDKGIDPIRTTVEVNGEQRRAVFRHVGYGGGDWLIEGIGANRRFWGGGMSPTFAGFRRFGIHFVECYKDDTLLFSKDDFDALTPPVSGTVESVGSDQATDESPGESPAVDLQGIPVGQPRSGEIYISHGKKHLTK